MWIRPNNIMPKACHMTLNCCLDLVDVKNTNLASNLGHGFFLCRIDTVMWPLQMLSKSHFWILLVIIIHIICTGSNCHETVLDLELLLPHPTSHTCNVCLLFTLFLTSRPWFINWCAVHFTFSQAQAQMSIIFKLSYLSVTCTLKFWAHTLFIREGCFPYVVES